MFFTEIRFTSKTVILFIYFLKYSYIEIEKTNKQTNKIQFLIIQTVKGVLVNINPSSHKGGGLYQPP